MSGMGKSTLNKQEHHSLLRAVIVMSVYQPAAVKLGVLGTEKSKSWRSPEGDRRPITTNLAHTYGDVGKNPSRERRT
jgi:hypothetical protein